MTVAVTGRGGVVCYELAFWSAGVRWQHHVHAVAPMRFALGAHARYDSTPDRGGDGSGAVCYLGGLQLRTWGALLGSIGLSHPLRVFSPACLRAARLA